jgi:hypothetical protein
MRIATVLIAATLILAGCQNHVDPGNPSPTSCDPSRGECPAGTPNTGQPPTTTPTNPPPTNTPPNPPARR